MGLVLAFAIFTCKVDADCIVVEAACPGWELVHRASSGNRRRVNDEAAQDIRCRAAEPGSRPIPECVSGVCARALGTKPSKQDCRSAFRWLDALRAYAGAERTALRRVDSATKAARARCPS